MVGWHHRLNGHESEWTPGVGDGQGGLACCISWVSKELDTTERLNSTKAYLEMVFKLAGIFIQSNYYYKSFIPCFFFFFYCFKYRIATSCHKRFKISMSPFRKIHL